LRVERHRQRIGEDRKFTLRRVQVHLVPIGHLQPLECDPGILRGEIDLPAVVRFEASWLRIRAAGQHGDQQQQRE
jgi:hypothetical protein